MKRIKLSPSMMCADFLHLQDELDFFREEGIDYLHIDVMDGHYVPNFTLGPGFCKVLAENSSIPLDIHLMIERVDKYIPVFAEIAASDTTGKAAITFHPEAEYHPIRQLHLIKSFGVRAGIAIDPSTSLESIKYMMPDVEMICIMTVNPGYSGQKLLPQTIEKISEIDAFCRNEGLDVEIEVDGNVSWENIPSMVTAGAETLVAGTSSLFDPSLSRKEAGSRLKNLITSLSSGARAV